MLTGEFSHKMDTKNRLFIPAKHREELGKNFMVAPSLRDKCLRVYSAEEWNRYLSPIKAMARKDAEKILRFLNRNAAQVSPDEQGRIVLTPALVQYAGISKDAMVVGCGDYSEIWAQETYDEMIGEEDTEDMKALLESYGL